MRKLALTMALVLLMGLVTVPAYAAEGASRNRDEDIQAQLPDPNAPDSPDYVTIEDEDVPLSYIRIEDPDNPGEHIYVPEDDVPAEYVRKEDSNNPGQFLYVLEKDVPAIGYIRVLDPENPGKYMYVLLHGLYDVRDPDVPLVESPQTGESGVDLALSVAALFCTAALAVTILPRKKADF